MKIQLACGRKLGIAASAAMLAMTLALTGCASSGTPRSEANGPSAASPNAGPDAEARCRAAIADVTKLCADDANSSRCIDAKKRSRAACI
ncbi:MAG: hypothetical protein RBT81_07665 [Gammaproteobacteria bacterium]|jgi:hypothetical protein|nr:hypothetical protein [Gammaproteobacteria bacterium]